MLAPTDPVLASDVQVGPPGEAEKEPEPQCALTSEAGLNDGFAFPFVFLGVFIAGTGGTAWLPEWFAADVLYAITVGIVLLGSLLASAGLGAPGVAGWLLVPLLLLAIRPVATLAAFTRSPVPLRERAFIGWFGIRGIGSLYYVAAVIDEGVLTASEANTVFWTVTALAGVSILAHGLTATSLTRRVAAPVGADG